MANYNEFNNLRQRMGSMVPRRQAAAAETRAATAAAAAPITLVQQRASMVVDWDDPRTFPDVNGGNPIPLAAMPDGTLWSTVNWIVRNTLSIYERYESRSAATLKPLDMFDAARRWLRTRPLFRALLQESVRRDLTYPDDVFKFLKDCVFNARTLGDYMPWKDPSQTAQAVDLRPFLDEPIVPPELDGSRELRAIQL